MEIEQSVGVSDAIITAFWDVFCRDGSREAEILELLTIAEVSGPVFYEQFESKEDFVERTIVRTLMTGSLTEAQTARLLFQCLQHA